MTTKQQTPEYWLRRLVFYSLMIVCLVSFMSISAYLSDADTARNRITIGSNVIEIVEEFEPPKKLEPGITFKKDVKVTNTGTVNCYIRVMAVFANGDMGSYCTVNWNDDVWCYNEQDGYWYYPVRVAAGATTPSLFTTVTLSEDIPEAEITDFDIIIYAESYQSYGFDHYTEAWENYQKNKPE